LARSLSHSPNRRAGAPGGARGQGIGGQCQLPLAVSAPAGNGFAIDPDKVAPTRRFDGVFALQTKMKLSALAAVLPTKPARDGTELFLATWGTARLATGGRPH